MTDPLTPAGLDLRDFPYMPLDVVRLRDSTIATKATDAEFRAAVMLWCAAWHQVPAASLPNDDYELAKFAGFGRDLKSWRKVKTMALHNFAECSDGRLYHTVIAEKANEAHDKKEAYRLRTARATAERKAKRDGQRNDGQNDKPEERDDERNDDSSQERNDHQVKLSVSEGKKEREVCESLTPASASNGAYPPEFDAFWLGYPDNSSSKFEAFEAFEKLPQTQQKQAAEALSAFVAWTRKQPADYTMLSAKKYLESHRFEKFVEEAAKISKAMSKQAKRVYLKYGSEAFDAWDKYLKSTTGRPAARDQNGGWWFDTPAPPTQASAA